MELLLDMFTASVIVKRMTKLINLTNLNFEGFFGKSRLTNFMKFSQKLANNIIIGKV